MSSLLRQFIHATLAELRIDPRMMSVLHGTGFQDSPDEPSDKEAHHIADEWLEEMGERSHHHKLRVHRYVARKWPMLVSRFRGDKHAARQTMYNLLDTRLSEGED